MNGDVGALPHLKIVELCATCYMCDAYHGYKLAHCYAKSSCWSSKRILNHLNAFSWETVGVVVTIKVKIIERRVVILIEAPWRINFYCNCNQRRTT